MRNTLIAIALIACTVMAGCKNDQIKPFLDNLHSDCTRDYTFSLTSGGVAGVGASGTVAGTIHCKPGGVDPSTPAPVQPPAQ